MILNQDNKVHEFEVDGKAQVCIFGEGEVAIENRMGKEYHTLTMLNGDEMVFVGSGVLFNNMIETCRPIKHRVRIINCTSDVIVEIVKGR